MMRAFVLTGFLVPFFTVGTFVFGPYVSIQYVAMALSATGALLVGLAGPNQLASPRLVWLAGGLLALFLATLSFGLILTPYQLSDIGNKAITQIFGLVIAIVFALLAARMAARDQHFTVAVVRATSLALGVVGALGIAQFILANVFDAGFLIHFSWLNTIAGGIIWNDPPQSDLIVRVNSIAAEPSHFARIMVLGLGLAALRVGMLGSTARKAVAPLMPRWTAYVILVSIIIASSLVGLVQAAVVIVLAYLLGRNQAALSPISLLARVSPIIALGIIFLVTVGGEALSKFWTLARIFDVEYEVYEIGPFELSAFAILANRIVMEGSLALSPLFGGGIGSHPTAYQVFAPEFIAITSNLEGLNAEDASGLLIRLLSETGLLGTLTFLAAMISPFAAAWSGHSRPQSATTEQHYIFVGLASSFGGTLIACLGRYGSYFDLGLWLLFGLTLGNACRLKNTKDHTRNAPQVGRPMGNYRSVGI